jgi:hypothetical protein
MRYILDSNIKIKKNPGRLSHYTLNRPVFCLDNGERLIQLNYLKI